MFPAGAQGGGSVPRRRLLEHMLIERPGTMMNTVAAQILAALMALCAALSAALGSPAPEPPVPPADKPVESAADRAPAGAENDTHGQGDASQAARYYEAGSLPLFQTAFSQLDEEAQGQWLDRIYEDGRILFWGAAVNLLDEDCALVQRCAEKTYADGNIVYFSTLAAHMSGDALELWLDRALEDGSWAFQSTLYDALGRGCEYDELEEKREQAWAETQAAEYGAVGVTVDGKDYYYQGQLVNIFLDIRPNRSFYTLNLNPKGSVNVKIIRDPDSSITGAAYMTEAEVAALLEDMGGAGAG